MELEQFVGRRKPDIVFYRDNKPIAALEICATHAVDSEKIADFQSMEMPWVEVEASQNIYLNWTISKPLPCKGCEPQIPSWSCDRCLQSPAKYVEDIERLLEKENAQRFAKKREDYEREQKRLSYLTPYNYVVKAKAICFFRSNGSYDYNELLICERYEGRLSDVIMELYLRDGTNDRILYSEEAPITEKSKRNISEYYKDWKLINRRSTEMVEITKWVSYDEMKRIRADWKSLYIWNAQLNRWILRQT